MKHLFISVLFISLLFSNQSQTKKVIFDLTTGDSKTFKTKILSSIAKNKTYYDSHLQELEVAVMIHGDAYQFFIKNKESALAKRIAYAHEEYEVEFMICQSGMRSRNIEIDTIFSFVKVIPNAAIGLIDKQNEGYAYIPVR